MTTELTRDQIINLISPSSKNSEHHDLAFANRVIDAMRDLTQRPAAQSEAQALAHNMMLWSEDAVHNCNEYVPVHVRTLEKVIAQLRDMPAPQQATPTRATREAEQRARMQARLATRHEGKATADFDLPPPNDAIQQATPSRFGSPDLQALIVQHATQQATPASAPQSLLMRLAGIAAECSDPDTTDALDALIAATQQATPEPLTVRIVSFAETNGKHNWTAMFVRTKPWDGLIGNAGGITIARGELWNRVAYAAERARCLLGERDTEPDILAYGDDISTPDEWKGHDPDALAAAQAKGGEQ